MGLDKLTAQAALEKYGWDIDQAIDYIKYRSLIK